MTSVLPDIDVVPDLQDDEVCHYVCCVDSEATYCGVLATGPYLEEIPTDQPVCVVCDDLQDNPMFCPIRKVCIYHGE